MYWCVSKLRLIAKKEHNKHHDAQDEIGCDQHQGVGQPRVPAHCCYK